jgi:hypothetical protein
MAWAGRTNAPGPFTFRGCDLRGEYLPAKEEVRVQLPATAPFLHRLSVSTRPSLQNSAHSGQHGGSLPFSGVMADKQCTCPASKPMWERYPPTPPFHCGENEIQASLISLASVGATRTPATNFREVIHLPDCKSGVVKQSWKRRTGALPALPTISGPVAQSAERPVVCGRVEGATPFGSAIFHGM